ncbi:hypothetical protein B0T22DRAFT_370765 [Podospora appendiculata]|uniref:Myb-like DNA-binding domain protein n=1 Tax=Podospora appendiculata TaxID=314037 RepID=A0AAE0XIS6_9PEZI|nr:hypothetical protein B0T22DRAFT_370765 [Podospora appendiculata]
MERPTKKPRVGLSPFQDDDVDIDANDDELNVAPEKINALRDPGYQLQKGRAFAAFKLKSAFERIFEKYGRDFTGVGDEIDLSTGKIVVNNGHVESLKRSAVGGGDEEDDEDNDDQDEDEDDVEDENEEDNGVLLSELGKSPLPPVTIAAEPVDIGGPWPAAGQLLGRPPLLSSLISPAHVHLPPMHMSIAITRPLPPPYGGFNPMQSWVEPAWRVPELPSPSVSNMTGPPVTRIVPRSQASMLLMAAESGGGGEDEDDILFGSSTVDLSTPIADRLIKTKKLLSPHLLLERGSVGKKNRQTTVSSVTKRSRNDTVKKSKDIARKTPLKERKSPKHTSITLPRETHSTTNTVQLNSEATAVGKNLLAETKKDDVYINYSSPSRTVAIKPSNQRLHVEILVQRSVDITSFQVIAPESADAGMTDHDTRVEPEADVQHMQDSHGSIDIEIANYSTEDSRQVDEAQHVHDPHDLDKIASGTPAPDPPSKLATVEVFSRNIVDPAYAFSDEDEPTIPTARDKPLRLGRKENKLPRIQGEELIETPIIPSTGEAGSHTEPFGARAPDPDEMYSSLDSYLEAKMTGPFIISDKTNEPLTGSRGEPTSSTTSEWEDINVATLLSSAEKIKARRAILPVKPSETVPSRAVPESPPAQAPTQTESPFVAPKAYLADKPRRKLKHATQEVKSSSPTGEVPPRSQSLIPLQEEELIVQASPGARIDAAPAMSCLPLEESTPSHALQPTEPDHTPIWNEEPTSPQTTKRLLSSKPRRSKSLFAVSTDTQEPTGQQANTPTNDVPNIETPTPITPITKKHDDILSLVSDDDGDEDELSLTPRNKHVTPTAGAAAGGHRESVSTRSVLHGSDPRRPSASALNMNRQRPSLLGSSRTQAVHTPTSMRHPASTPLAKRASSSALRGPGGNSSGRRRSQLLMLRRPGRQVSPTYPRAEELVQTPGGTMRRCGENGSRCDRDFCFVCL